MLSHDLLVKAWFAVHAWAGYALEAALVVVICGGAWLMQRRGTRSQAG
jgi:hypothetical protein